jgi:hypothetical protein
MQVNRPQREAPVTMAEDRRSPNHTKGSPPSRGPWRSRLAAIRTEQLENSRVRPNPRGMNSGRCRNRRKKRRGQYDLAVPFARASIYVIAPLKLNSVALVSERTMPTERLPLVGEVMPTFADRGCRVVSATDSHGR